MKPQPVAARPHWYRAELKNVDVASRLIHEDSSLRGLIIKLRSLSLSSFEDVTIQAEIEGWGIPLGVPRQVYAYSQQNQWLLQPAETVPEHWDFPAPYLYFALDWERGIYLEAPLLSSLVEQMHQWGCSLVASKDMKIGARFSRESVEADDVIQIPLSLICHEYDEEEDDVIVVDEGWDDEDNIEAQFLCSPLPAQAELLPADMVEPHYLFGAVRIKQRRLNTLL